MGIFEFSDEQRNTFGFYENKWLNIVSSKNRGSGF